MGAHVQFNQKLKLNLPVILNMKPSSPFIRFHLNKQEKGIKSLKRNLLFYCCCPICRTSFLKSGQNWAI